MAAAGKTPALPSSEGQYSPEECGYLSVSHDSHMTHFEHWVCVLQQPAKEGVASFVVGHHSPLLGTQDSGLLLHACQSSHEHGQRRRDSPATTLSTAYSKSFWVTAAPLSLAACRAASFTMLAMSAPVERLAVPLPPPASATHHCVQE